MTNFEQERAFESFGVYDEPPERRIGFFLAPTFMLFSFVAALDPFRVANRLCNRPLYGWEIFSIDGEPVLANNRIPIPVDKSIVDVPACPLVFVCGPYEPQYYDEPRVVAWLRRLARGGSVMGALDTGGRILAQAGLLDGYRCTVHWSNLPGFKELYPGLDVSSELFEVDRDRLTCAGGTAAMDMALCIIGKHHGQDLALAVAENFIHKGIRPANDHQRISLRQRTGIDNRHLIECIELMENNLEQPLSAGELSAVVGVSKRQLERLFQSFLQTTPSRYYSDLRILEGHRLLEQTSLPITEIALACGYPSPGYFSHLYRARFGCSPRETRVALRSSAKRGSLRT